MPRFCRFCRGCLTEPASELDLAWSGYVETVERLVVAVDGKTDPLGLNAEKAVRQLDTRISDAIMHAMENGPALEEKVIGHFFYSLFHFIYQTTKILALKNFFPTFFLQHSVYVQYKDTVKNVWTFYIQF